MFKWLSDQELSGWTVTADADTNYQAYMLNQYIRLENCKSTGSLHYTFNISSNVLYKSGTGTKEDPYLIKYFPVGDEYTKAKKDDKKNKNSDF